VLKILSDDNQDWYEAELGNETGMVPKNYFEPYVPVVEENGWDDEVTYAPIPQKKKVQIVTVLYDYAVRQKIIFFIMNESISQMMFSIKMIL